MSEVKRFKACPFLAAFMTEGVDCVLASDYDNQAQEIDRLTAELEQVKNSLSDPESVLVNIMRGSIAKPTLRSMLTLYGDIYNTEEAASSRIAELESELEQVNKALEAIYDCDYQAPHDATDAEVSESKKRCIFRMRKLAKDALNSTPPAIPATQVLVERELLERVERYFSGFVSDEPPAYALGSNGLATIRAILSSKGDV